MFETAERELLLSCTVAEAHALAEVQEYAYLRLDESPPLASENETVGIEDALALPSQRCGSLQAEMWAFEPRVHVTYDRIARGEVEVRYLSEVTSADGERFGRLAGLIVDDQGTITQVVLERGRLWRHRRITVPAEAVNRFKMDHVTLGLSKSELEAYVPVAADSRVTPSRRSGSPQASLLL